jgi:hypothetical protein
MRKLIVAVVAAAALAVPAAAAADPPGQAVKECAGTSFGQVVSSVEPGFNLGQHQKGVPGPGGARGFVDAHCTAA